MAKPTGFLEFKREGVRYRDVEERLADWSHVQHDFTDKESRRQASRCMDCGIPFCNNGCPLGNIIPDWNELVYRGKWEDALSRLHSTNNFPEFTGMVCPAPCEAACVLGINEQPVTIKQVEWEIVRRGWDEGWIRPVPPNQRTGRSVAIVGSGPAGLSAAQQLTRAGHTVTVFEKNERIGGLLRYGIPDFKLEKSVIDRRLDQMQKEGVSFQTGVHVGVDLEPAELRRNFDAVLLCMGAEHPRDLPIEGRELDGVHFAMDFLTQQNRRTAGDPLGGVPEILATGKDVIVLGGGDTGSDCVGTSHRQGAKSVTSIELLDRPPDERCETTPWPLWPRMFRSSSSHDEGGEREYALLTKRFEGQGGRVEKLVGVEVRFGEPDESGRSTFEEIPGTEFEKPAGLVLLAMGFVHPVHEGLIEGLGVERDARGNVVADLQRFETSEPGIFAAGDCRRGQSLVVWAQSEGREAARAVDSFLMGESRLQSKQTTV
uniref:NADPH-dependent glutamate synthase beta chain and related oxidoreductases n=1 Tax=uncultured myxobacterium HF0200_01L06 TaxID=723556 RepID=E7C3J9_9BACT|nr:NADPH-dependent glutamate synthase beta chain and related oxidoreductases [uncultured myxobacterium HF0200_01L06]